jgi:hypothetical protein
VREKLLAVQQAAAAKIGALSIDDLDAESAQLRERVQGYTPPRLTHAKSGGTPPLITHGKSGGTSPIAKTSVADVLGVVTLVFDVCLTDGKEPYEALAGVLKTQKVDLSERDLAALQTLVKRFDFTVKE